MKKGWALSALGSVCTKIQDGAHQSPQTLFRESGHGRFLYITSKNIRNNGLDLLNVSYVNHEFHDQIYLRCKPEVGDVLLTKDGANTGNVTLNTIEEPFSLLSSVCLIKTDPEYLVPGFLKYYIQSPSGLAQITGQMNGAAIKRIILKDIKLATIPLPNVLEQKRIIAILDEAFEGIATAKASAEKNLQNAREVFDGCLDASLVRHGTGYTEAVLGDEIDLQPGYAFSSGGYTVQEPSVRLLRGDNIMQGYFRWDDVKRWPSDQTEAYTKFALKEGDVVLAMDRPWVKAGLKRAQICKEDLPCLQVQRTARLRCRQKLRQDFLFHLTGSHKFSSHLLDVQTGLGVPHISGQQIESFKFMCPPLAQQESIAESLNQLSDNVQTLTEIFEKKVLALDELKQSLLHRAFNGDL